MPISMEKLDYAFGLIEYGISKGYFPGAAAAVGYKNGIYKIKHYGNRCLIPKKLPMERDTLFDMASLTKVIATNTLFMIFLEKGLISLYDKVSEYVEYFKDEKKVDITIFNLLTHTAGLPAFGPLYRLCRDFQDAVRFISREKLIYEPGSRVVYSDYGFILLKYILEKVGEDSLDNLCRKNIFEPLEMKDTCFNPKSSNVAATEVDSESGEVLMGICHDENGRFFNGVSGHAGLFSNLEDITKFASMLINEGSYKGRRLISKVAFKAMIHNYTEGLEENRALGWCVKGAAVSSGGDIISPKAFGHTGFTGTSLWTDIENDIYIVLLTNRVHPTRENTNIIRFRRIFHNAVMSAIEG
ncbi:serine hydrolase domain-containing protein [Candidatus Clostridium radicumherbarum]|uniref:Serine hydrolase domain-containing protein n=1 Tax=Candidatus Clostridium radicumherbarum TaxID=3381662 RepID=A0ABW8TUL5_9CLOT